MFTHYVNERERQQHLLEKKKASDQVSADPRDVKLNIPVPLSLSVTAQVCPPSADNLDRPASAASKRDAAPANSLSAQLPHSKTDPEAATSGSDSSMNRSIDDRDWDELAGALWLRINDETRTRVADAQEILTHRQDKNESAVVKSLYTMAISYRHGLGVKTDSAMALSLYREAAEKHHAGACYELTKLYLHGDSLMGVNKNLAAAKKYALLALGEDGRENHKDDYNTESYNQMFYIEQLQALEKVIVKKIISEVVETIEGTKRESPTSVLHMQFLRPKPVEADSSPPLTPIPPPSSPVSPRGRSDD